LYGGKRKKVESLKKDLAPTTCVAKAAVTRVFLYASRGRRTREPDAQIKSKINVRHFAINFDYFSVHVLNCHILMLSYFAIGIVRATFLPAARRI
jgi:hypothetical protein